MTEAELELMALAEYVQELEGKLAKQQADSPGQQGPHISPTGDQPMPSLPSLLTISSVHILEVILGVSLKTLVLIVCFQDDLGTSHLWQYIGGTCANWFAQCQARVEPTKSPYMHHRKLGIV